MASTDPRASIITMLKMFSVAGQILELPLNALTPVVDKEQPMPGTEGLKPEDMANMEEGRRIAVEVYDVVKQAQDKLIDLEKDLASWTPPMSVLDQFMKKGPPKF